MASSPRITTRLAPDIADLVELAAEAAGYTRSEWVRAAIAAALRVQLTEPARSRAGPPMAVHTAPDGAENVVEVFTDLVRRAPLEGSKS